MNEGTGNISKRSGLISEITEANLQYIADRIGTKVPEHINNTDIHVTTDEKAVWNEKQDKLTFDDTPTAESGNPVKSGGVYAALDTKADKATTLSAYGITDAYTKIEVNTALNEKAGKATTLAGYGITDAYTKTDMDDALDTKADKADGKGLSANDLTDELKVGYDEATLLAMYNRTDVTPSPEEWFMIDETTGAVSIDTGVFNYIDLNVYDPTKIVIPWKIGNVTVKAIDTFFTQGADYMFDITEIVIPNSVTKISDNAFYDETWGSLEGLQSINIPSSLSYIGANAFRGCTALSKIKVPVGAYITVTNNFSAFINCSGLKDISPILKCMTHVADNAFNCCSGLSTVVIPENITKIFSGSFSYTNIDCFTVLNKNCEIEVNAFCKYDDAYYPTHSYPSLIKGYKGSTAETFATNANIPFMSIEGTEVNAKSDKATTLAGYGITDAYTKNESDAALAAKADKTTITTNADGKITLSDNTEFRVADTVTSISLTVPTGVSDDFISSVVFKSGATATTISVIGTAKWCGDSVADGEFTPVANRVYNIVFYNDGFNVVGIVGGYSS